MSIPIVSNPSYSFGFPDSHRFPMEKFGLLENICREQNWLTGTNYFRPGRAKMALLELAHCSDYLARFTSNQQTKQELRRMGLPWSEGLLKRSLIAPNGTFLTAQLALKHGIACHLAGGTHHAHYNFASGFCILNDLAVTAKALLAQKKVKKILIFDCDVHQGDGTASILADEPRAFTCSIHCEKNFPVRKAHSDLDIGLPITVSEQDYLETVASTLQTLIINQQPELVIYDAGVDVFAGDPLGLLSISEVSIKAREKIVLSLCKQAHIPVATVIGGGYDDNRLALAKRHAFIIEAAHSIFC
ncbi:MAG: acetoin utilization deacetylase AcuC-like enzyme [Paraglaciecola psychrophila]|jgi:acetoin utilization deacetylase AcuC-like enzyme